MNRFKDIVLDEALTRQQRQKRKIMMKRLAPKIARAKKRAEKKMANPEKLKKRANKRARQLIAGTLLKGRDLTNLSYSEREKLEKRLDKLKPKIAKVAKKILPKVKKVEMERLKQFRDRGDD